MGLILCFLTPRVPLDRNGLGHEDPGPEPIPAGYAKTSHGYRCAPGFGGTAGDPSDRAWGDGEETSCPGICFKRGFEVQETGFCFF